MSEALQTYEAEQEKLRAAYEGTHDVVITAPKEPEVNPEVYHDVEPMLYRGFIAVEAEINEIHVVFKSLNHHEFEMLRFSGVLRKDRMSSTAWSTFLAYGVFMIDGVNVLPERDKWLPQIAKMFDEFPKEARAKIIRHVSEANRKASRAVVLTEAYAMEFSSRYRWMQLKGMDLTSPSVTGIDGTQRLGLNWSQHLWRAVNLVEDRNEQQEREWENAKFVGSCFAGKGIQKVYTQDTERRRKDKDERLARKDLILREIVLGEVLPDKAQILQGAVMTAPRTVEELTDQLTRDLNGDKDWHDKVIEAHETRIRDQYKNQRQQQEVVAQENSVEFGNRYIVGGTDTAGLTPKEVSQRVARTKQLEAQAAARMQVPDEKTEKFLGKWGVLGPEVTTEVSTTDRDISEAVPLPQPRPQGTPFGKK